jgi:hypothetical protein
LLFAVNLNQLRSVAQDHLGAMRGAPITVVVEAAGFLEDAGDLDAVGTRGDTGILVEKTGHVGLCGGYGKV